MKTKTRLKKPAIDAARQDVVRWCMSKSFVDPQDHKELFDRLVVAKNFLQACDALEGLTSSTRGRLSRYLREYLPTGEPPVGLDAVIADVAQDAPQHTITGLRQLGVVTIRDMRRFHKVAGPLFNYAKAERRQMFVVDGRHFSVHTYANLLMELRTIRMRSRTVLDYVLDGR